MPQYEVGIYMLVEVTTTLDADNASDAVEAAKDICPATVLGDGTMVSFDNADRVTPLDWNSDSYVSELVNV